MTTTPHSYRRFFASRRAVMIGAIAIFIAALVSIGISVMTAHTIAPPSLRILDFVWTALSWLKG